MANKRNTLLIPHKRDWQWIVINSSGGKDSQTALRQVVHAADDCGFPRHRIVVSHQDLGRGEWRGTRDLAQKQAEHYGLRFEVSRYHNKEGKHLDLLEYVEQRGKWPSSAQRFCTTKVCVSTPIFAFVYERDNEAPEYWNALCMKLISMRDCDRFSKL